MQRTVLVMWEWTCEHSPIWRAGADAEGGLRDPGAFACTRRTDGPQLLLDASGVRSWTPDGTEPALDRFGAILRREAEAVRSGTAEERAAALETAARLHASLSSGRILWFGGADVPE